MVSIEKIQKAGQLCKDLKKHGFAEDFQEAYKQAESIYNDAPIVIASKSEAAVVESLVLNEQDATSSFISELESRLVDLKVEEAALRRQYRDPNAPEVSFVSDQASELEAQIREERERAVSSENGQDLNRLALEETGLISDVDFATETLQSARTAADNSRRESQRQLKFIVVLSQPQLPVEPDHNWRWQAFLASVGIVVLAWGVGGFILNAMKKS